MLFITRLVGESIELGDDIRITICKVSGNQVRLGIEAPRHISISRSEIYKRVKKENKLSQKEKK